MVKLMTITTPRQLNDFSNKTLSEGDAVVDGIWVICLTNDPKEFFNSISSRYHFMSTYETSHEVESLKEGIFSTKEFLIKFGGYPQFDSFQADLDITKKMFLAVMVLN